MASFGKCNFTDLKKFQENFEQLTEQQIEIFMQECARELAARLLAKVIKRTPVGQYPTSSGKKGGTLRRGWTGSKSSAATQYANSLQVRHIGDVYEIEIINPVEYASYVEFGHRTRNHAGWVEGRFMLTISESEVESIAPKVLERKLYNVMKGAFA